MGRYYKTSTPQDIDFLYKLPYELLMKGVEKVTGELDQEAITLAGLDKSLVADVLPIESHRSEARKIIQEMSNKVNSLSQELINDPLGFRKKHGKVAELAKNIYNEWTTGRIGQLQALKTGYTESYKDFQAQVKAGRIKDPESIVPLFLKTLNDIDAKGLNWDDVSKQYDVKWNDPVLYPYRGDYYEKYMKIASEIEKQEIEGSYTTDRVSGERKYRVTINDKQEWRTREEIDSILTSMLYSDQELANYLIQRDELGITYGNTEIKDGRRVLKPYRIPVRKTIKENGKDKIIETYDWNPESPVGLTMSSIANTYDVFNRTVKESERGDEYAVKSYESMIGALKEGLPDTNTTGMSLSTTPQTVAGYGSERANSIISGTIGLLMTAFNNKILNLPVAQQNAMKNDIKVATESAKNGDLTEMLKIYKKYNISDPKIESQLVQLIPEFGNATEEQEILKNQYQAFLEMAQAKNPQFKIFSPAHPKGVWDFKKLDKYINSEILSKPEINTANVHNIWATSGNAANLWLNPVSRAAAINVSNKVDKLLENNANWPSKIIVSVPDTKGNYVQREGTVESLSSNDPFTGSTILSIAMDSDEGKQSKLQATVGTAQVIPQELSFTYFGVNSIPQNTTIQWGFSVPLTLKDGSSARVILPPESVGGMEWEALKMEAEPIANQYSNQKRRELSNMAIERAGNMLGVPHIAKLYIK